MAEGERVLTFDCAGLGTSTCSGRPAFETWTLRGLRNEVLRVWTRPFGEPWQWQADYVYRGGRLLAAVAPDAETPESGRGRVNSSAVRTLSSR